MIKIADRRVLIRDDGFGRSSKEPRSFSEFVDADALILLGNPGSGKSTLFGIVGGTYAKTVRAFLLEPAPPVAHPLFLDGLDEYRKIFGTDAAADRVAQALIDLGKPKFRLSCRAADWFSALDQSVISAASPSGRVIVLDLLPFDDAEIRTIVAGRLTNADQLIDEAKSFGIANLLGNPQTLELMVSAWKSGKHPRNKFEAYQYGVENLLIETNAAHQPRGTAVVAMKDLRRAAGAACATLLLADGEALCRVDAAPHEDDVVAISTIPYAPMVHADLALTRRVFSSPKTDLFQPAHRTIAEFLAAEFLASRIRNGLPVTRTLAMMCALDGAPVSALRGLFAWLMCHLGIEAESLIVRDPYAVATYGDGACLQPAVQIAIWSALVKATDPWFLASEDERGAFNGLANRSTRPILLSILTDSNASSHLLVACLEAIAASADNLDLDAEIAAHAFTPTDNTWLRSTALRALLRHGKAAVAQDAEQHLAAQSNDMSAPALRITLLRETARQADFVARVVSILHQYKSQRDEHSVIGILNPLRDLIRPIDLDTLLDTASQLLPEDARNPVELELLFRDWLIDRLATQRPIDPLQLLSWLRSIKPHQSDCEVDEALVARFGIEPSLFAELFDTAVREAAPETTVDLFRCLRGDFTRCVPYKLWPHPPHLFLLTKAATEPLAAIAAGYFQEGIWRIPQTGFTLAEAEQAAALLCARPDLAAAARGWDVHQLEPYVLEERERVLARRQETEETRANNVKRLAPDIASIASGNAVGALRWAVRYYGKRHDADASAPLEAPLVELTDNAIANAFLSGFDAFVDTPNLPTVDAMLQAGRNNGYSTHLILLMLSASMRLRAHRPIPQAAEAVVAAGIIARADIFVSVPDTQPLFADWFSARLIDSLSSVRSLLADAWRDAVDRGASELPCFYDLTQRPECAAIVSSMIPPLFAGPVLPTSQVAQTCVLHLLFNEPETARQMATAALAKVSTTDEMAGLWLAGLFVLEPMPFDLTTKFATLSESGAWAAIDLWRGGDVMSDAVAPMPSEKTAALIASVGARFHNAGSRLGSSWGRHNDHDAAEFVAGNIKYLASCDDEQAGLRLAQLAGDPALVSYRDLARHHLAQRLRQRREQDFEAPERERISTSLMNSAPANMADLLAVVVDHFEQLSAEIRGTSFARLNAYWGDKNRSYEQPKDEPICSKLLAADLQHRIAPLDLAATVEHHMIAEKRCDIVVLQAAIRLLPIEVKHHYHPELWNAWRTQLDHLYASDVRAQGVGIYCVLWSGEKDGRRMPALPAGIARPTSAAELYDALTSLIPADDRHRLSVVVIDISPMR
ncbi:hypothetical protein [Hyphomicrobium sp.]|uniref:NACHT domain-containing protein n=1 Tax=Hyphomicrobium sp. TaxID=82 RepID=UPI000FA27A3E|nr:hypothetical protein [Hyphomicrobium sp.]RUO98962.1 MAG: hypothetical protein EKK30_08905 [Hyphomicrobium sp.]